MDQLAAWHYQQGRGVSPYSLPLTPTSLATTPISRFSPGAGGFPHPAGFPGFPGGLPPGLAPHIKQEYERAPGLIHQDDKNDSPKKKVRYIEGWWWWWWWEGGCNHIAD